MKIPAMGLVLGLGACATLGPDAAQSLADAERAFAAHSVRENMHAAFLAHFAPDGVLVRSGWKRARDVLDPARPPPVVLDWRPVYVEVAASGELGLSTGPWKLVAKDKPGAQPAFGQFVSVWRREPGGPWKVAVDLGIAHAQPALWEAPLERHVASADGARAAGSLSEAERAFDQVAARDGLRAAYRAHGSPRLRLYRQGHAPFLGRDAALASADLASPSPGWTVERAVVARSGDFGYVTGAMAARDAPQVPQGWFLRVWRREPGGWRVALDVTQAAPR